MIKKKLTKLVGLKKVDFDFLVTSNQIKVQPVRLIPTLKTGDEMALTSIFLSVVKLVKEYRDGVFKELKLSRSGKAYYYSEVSFPEINKSRIDGLIIIVLKGVITEAVFFEMKNKTNLLDVKQIENYINLAKKLKVKKLVTVSNEFVADSSHSPMKIKPSKMVQLFHFSWTYLITRGQLLLFNNELNIKDEDQVEIMREALYYFENPISGIRGYSQMKAGWKELSENVRAEKPLKLSDAYIEEAVLSWYEQEKDMALLLSRKLGVLVKSSVKNPSSLKTDIKRIVKENFIIGNLDVKDAVSGIKIKGEFERRSVSMNIKMSAPLDRGTVAQITWISRQLENCKKKDAILFQKLRQHLWIETDIKYAKDNLKVKLDQLSTLSELSKGKEINAFHIVLIDGFGVGFSSNKKFIILIEKMLLEFYMGIVQHMKNWNRPAPKLEHDEDL